MEVKERKCSKKIKGKKKFTRKNDVERKTEINLCAICKVLNSIKDGERLV